GRSEYSRLRPSGRTITKSASSRIASCRETPGWPISTSSTSSLTERSPSRRASMRRRRVGSARTWKTSGMATYYYSEIYRVNNMSLPGDALEPAELRQRLGDLLRQPDGVVAAQVDHLLCDAELQQFSGKLDQLIPVLAIPTELERAADLGGVAAHPTAGIVEFLDDLRHELWVAARDVPHIRVASGQPERGLALGADPDRWGRLLAWFWIRDRVFEVVVTDREVRSVVGGQRLHDV